MVAAPAKKPTANHIAAIIISVISCFPFVVGTVHHAWSPATARKMGMASKKFHSETALDIGFTLCLQASKKSSTFFRAYMKVLLGMPVSLQWRL